MAPIDIAFVKLISKFKALEKIMFILDQTITGKQKRIDEAYVDTSLNSLPNKETNISPATPLSKKNNIGIEKEKIKTFLNLVLIAVTSSLFFAFDNSGKIISKLAASN